MRYTVVWAGDPRKALAEIWLRASSRRAVADAADRVDRELSVDPTSKGESLSEGLRAIVAEPLRIVFSVRIDDRIVDIESVRLNEPEQDLDPD